VKLEVSPTQQPKPVHKDNFQKGERGFQFEPKEVEVDAKKNIMKLTYLLDPPSLDLTKDWELELSVTNCETSEPYECKNASITNISRPVAGSEGKFELQIPANFIPENVTVSVQARLCNPKTYDSCPNDLANLGTVIKKKSDQKIKIELFLRYDGKGTRYTMREKSTFDQLKANIKEKTKKLCREFHHSNCQWSTQR